MKKLAGRGGVFGMSGVFRIFDQIIKTKNQEVMTAEPFLQPKGGYRKLRVYKKTEIIYDITFYFTSRYLKKSDRTIDQMVQAARSGKQNIAEGSKASMTSTETELKLTNVAKASLEELLIDYEDYLRVRNMEQWGMDHPRMERLRSFCSGESFSATYRDIVPRLNQEEICNLAITLINQAIYLLKRMLERQQEMFVERGGVREQMSRARIAYRRGSAGAARSDKSD